jgi:hypothetical protein
MSQNATSVTVTPFLIVLAMLQDTQDSESPRKKCQSWHVHTPQAAYSVLLSQHEKDAGKCFKLEMSKSSINLRSDTLAFAPAKRWYSSNTEVRHQRCNFLKHPTTQPVRCCTFFCVHSRIQMSYQFSEANQAVTQAEKQSCSFTFPRLQWISTGWFLVSTQ